MPGMFSRCKNNKICNKTLLLLWISFILNKLFIDMYVKSIYRVYVYYTIIRIYRNTPTNTHLLTFLVTIFLSIIFYVLLK